MLILAKFLAGEISKNLWFQQSQSASFQLSYGQKESGTLQKVSQSWTIWCHSNRPDKFSSQLPEYILPYFLFFVGNLAISVFIVSSKEKAGSMVLPVGEWSEPLTSFIYNAQGWVRLTAGSRSNHFTHSSPAFPPTPASLPGLDGNLQAKRMCQVSSASTSLHSDGRRWSTGHGLDALNCTCAPTSISLPTLNVCLAQGRNRSACFIWFLLFSSPVPL